MTHATSLPPDLHQWVTRHVAGMDTATVTDASWPRGESRVWRLRADHGEAFVKLYPSTEKYEREVKGCEHAARALADTEAPHLLSSDPQRPAVVLSGLPGRVVRGLPLDQTEEQQVHRLAGDLLRRWHVADEPISGREHQRIMEAVTAQADEAAMILERLGDRLAPAERDLVRDAARDLPDLAHALPLAYRHGDYSPRNWLWDPAAEHHGLIDFEESAPGLAIEDLVWLCGAAWPTRPDLRDAFLTGYGRLLSSAEQRALVLLTARLGVSYLSTGLTKTDTVLIDRGRTVLDHMVRAPR
ncbi:aminoglycoside phosphotransferase family protein [Streptomyces sp. ME02-6987-2C]|uniref:aminoglycoside phosphotransferase family protein n=1 Tax=unclassified Streptomyces TaxID=2593676 RepID=UPI00087D0968|nr:MULTISPECIES: aminoglycoside phosphotransferase family protein [unclassified Streptomyces]MDX3367442.1 aminoglycoside phosphotransferase family protein [Streptomyces sp. ME02-6987-2C]MDX3423742.1 aminoglycoside phosphotransferase family protein [Streptomyces sp. ME02-6985-2c]REH20640.1 Ser/Thr protein kinase RdoA (MazF antagonist) [Streptomyces sp. 2221.1]SDT31018.1 Ser/Thr protein kinase RdoA involved in Cpx stress response, MazF antagonist [Streptomyces sp. 2114.2]